MMHRRGEFVLAGVNDAARRQDHTATASPQ